MKNHVHALSFLVAVLVAGGCASTQITQQQSDLGSAPIARPERILVYNFASTPADLQAGEQSGTEYGKPNTPPTEKELEMGRKLGAEVASRLVEKINGMGLTAVVGNQSLPARNGDIVILGHFESIEQGSAGKRLVIGFGSGGTDLRTVVTGYLQTPQGLRKLGSGTVESKGSKGPGLVVPLLVTAATANPIGLVVGGAVKLTGEASGYSTIEGAGKRTADQIADRLEQRFKQEGWI